jgi:hypothetical protein
MRAWQQAGLAILGLVVGAVPARAESESKLMRQVRLTTEPAQTQGCTKLTIVSDDSAKDLRRKIVRAGGNTGLVTFGGSDLAVIYAEVFNCTGAVPPTSSPAAPRLNPAPAAPPAPPPAAPSIPAPLPVPPPAPAPKNPPPSPGAPPKPGEGTGTLG